MKNSLQKYFSKIDFCNGRPAFCRRTLFLILGFYISFHSVAYGQSTEQQSYAKDTDAIILVGSAIIINSEDKNENKQTISPLIAKSSVKIVKKETLDKKRSALNKKTNAEEKSEKIFATKKNNFNTFFKVPAEPAEKFFVQQRSRQISTTLKDHVLNSSNNTFYISGSDRNDFTLIIATVALIKNVLIFQSSGRSPPVVLV